MTPIPNAPPNPVPPDHQILGQKILGMNAIVSVAHAGGDIGPVWEERLARVARDGHDAAAYVDLSMILQSHGRTEDALSVLGMALAERRGYCVVHGDGSGVRILAFVRPGDFMANTPIDFLLAGSNATLWLYYIDETTTALADMPAHDVAFMAVGEANDSGPYLETLKRLLRDWPVPVMNNLPDLIAGLTRDGVCDLLADEPSIVSPRTVRLSREELMAVALGSRSLDELDGHMSYPVIVRPVGTHAGQGLERILGPGDLVAWLAVHGSETAYVAPFVDYRNALGMYQKQRIVLIDGRPFASHMATSEHWMVHYMNASMVENADRRAAEAQWMADFDTDFAVRHRAAFEALYRKLPLNYFGIDSAELPDGRLVVFEVDVAMIVHAMDDAVMFGYKQPAMRKLFDAFLASAERARGPDRGAIESAA